MYATRLITSRFDQYYLLRFRNARVDTHDCISSRSLKYCLFFAKTCSLSYFIYIYMFIHKSKITEQYLRPRKRNGSIIKKYNFSIIRNESSFFLCTFGVERNLFLILRMKMNLSFPTPLNSIKILVGNKYTVLCRCKQHVNSHAQQNLTQPAQ